jgi:hypothetical protein
MIGRNPIPDELRAPVEMFAAEFEELRRQDAPRLERYARLRKDDDRLRSAQGSKLADDRNDYGRKGNLDEDQKRHDIALPFGPVLKIKHSYRIAGRLPEFVVDRREESPQERYRSETMERIWHAIIQHSNGDSQFADGAQDGSDLGTTWFDLYFDPQKQMPRFCAIDPATILVVTGFDDPHNFERVYRFWEEPVTTVRARFGESVIRGADVAVGRIEANRKEDNREYVTIVQMCDKNVKLQFALGGRVPLDEKIHASGFAPYVGIPNIGLYRDVHGWADREFYRDIVAYIEREFGAEADIIRSVANGSYLESGTGLSPKAIQSVLRDGGVVGGRRDGKVEPIQPPQIPQFVPEHHQMALMFLKMLSFTPDAAWGLGGAGSGSSKQVDLQPQLELTSMKQLNWSRGVKRLAGYAYQMIENVQAGVATYSGRVPGPGGKDQRFTPFELGPGLSQAELINETGTIYVPRTPTELFAGDYAIRVVFSNRIDPDDPAYILAEINKFRQGIQSLETTLEKLGVNNPADEMRRMEQEADRFPWLNNGMIALLKAQIAAQGGNSGQGAGGGGDQAAWADPTGALGMTQTKDGPALNADALTSLLPGPGAGSGQA